MQPELAAPPENVLGGAGPFLAREIIDLPFREPRPEVTAEIVEAWKAPPAVVAETERRAAGLRERAYALFSALMA